MRTYKFAIAGLLVILSLSLAGCNACQENIFTKLGDSLATIGKSGVDKDKILAERKASRAVKCAEQKAGEMKKSMGF